MTMNVLIEGADGLGKSTLAAGLSDFFMKAGHTCQVISEPNHALVSGVPPHQVSLRDLLLAPQLTNSVTKHRPTQTLSEQRLSAPVAALLALAGQLMTAEAVRQTPPDDRPTFRFCDRGICSTYVYQMLAEQTSTREADGIGRIIDAVYGKFQPLRYAVIFVLYAGVDPLSVFARELSAADAYTPEDREDRYEEWRARNLLYQNLPECLETATDDVDALPAFNCPVYKIDVSTRTAEEVLEQASLRLLRLWQESEA